MKIPQLEGVEVGYKGYGDREVSGSSLTHRAVAYGPWTSSSHTRARASVAKRYTFPCRLGGKQAHRGPWSAAGDPLQWSRRDCYNDASML